MKKFCLVVLCCIALNGCIGANKPVPSTFFYIPEYLSPVDLIRYDKIPKVVKISRFSIAPEFSSINLVYSEKKNILQKYYYHKWIANPADFTGSLLTKDLAESEVFAAVLPYDSILDHDYTLEGRVNKIYEQNNDTGWSAVFSLSVTFIDNKAKATSDKIIFQKTYNMTEPCEEKVASCLADGMSRIMPILSIHVAKDVVKGITSE